MRMDGRFGARISLVLVLVACLGDCLCSGGGKQPPHVLFIVADDLGWNDVGWHGSEILTPTLDSLAKSGVILDHSYVQPICSPTRSSIMSGKFVSHTGIQSLIHSTKPCGLPTNITTIAQQMRKLGYETHAIGKWHQGYCKKAYTPSQRGFDSFFGYYTGAEEYFTHLRSDKVGNTSWTGLDFHYDVGDQYINVENMNGTYSAHVFASQAVQIINQHNTSKPLYMYLPYQSVHGPLEVPPEYPAKYPNISDKGRRTFAGMVSALDEAIANVTAAWSQKGLYENSVIIFTTDNGGLVHAGGNNYPLRGQKFTLWEGGTRGVGFVSGPLLNKTGYIYPGLVHVVDWYPTLVELAGGSVDGLDVDGYPMWSHFSNNLTSPRTSFPYLIHNESNQFAIRVGPWKLLINVKNNSWYPPPPESSLEIDPALNLMNMRGVEEEQQLPQSSQSKLTGGKDTVYLFNLDDDPNEHNDLSHSNPQQLATMMQHLEDMKHPYTPDFCDQVKASPKCNPANFAGAYSHGWC